MPRCSSPATCSSLAALLLVGCGDGLVGADYQGEPLLSLAGQVLVVEDLPVVDAEVRVAVFWSSLGGHGPQHEQQAEVSTQFPARYTLDLYTPPPDEVLYEPEHSPGTMATGLPMIYEDQDGDGLFDPSSEPVLGGARDALVLYLPSDMRLDDPPPDHDDTSHPPPPDDTAVPMQGTLSSGYHAVVRLGDACQLGVMELSLADSEQVDMMVGGLRDYLADLDCDGAYHEWDGL